MAMLALRPLVVDLIDNVTLGRDLNLNLLLEEIEVRQSSVLAGLSIEQAAQRLNRELLVLAVKKRDGRLIANPPRETAIADGDQLVVIGTRDQLASLDGMI